MHSKKILAHQQRKQHRHNRYNHARHEEDESGIAEPLNKLGTGLNSYHRRKHAQTHVVEHPETGLGNIPKIRMHRSQPAKYQAGQKCSSTSAQTYRNSAHPNAQRSDDCPDKNPNSNESHITRVARADWITDEFSDAFHVPLRTAYAQNISSGNACPCVERQFMAAAY